MSTREIERRIYPREWVRRKRSQAKTRLDNGESSSANYSVIGQTTIFGKKPRRDVKPETSSPPHEMRVIFDSIDTEQQECAMGRLNEACDSSNLDSSSSDTGKKRSLRKSTKYDSDSSYGPSSDEEIQIKRTCPTETDLAGAPSKHHKEPLKKKSANTPMSSTFIEDTSSSNMNAESITTRLDSLHNATRDMHNAIRDIHNAIRDIGKNCKRNEKLLIQILQRSVEGPQTSNDDHTTGVTLIEDMIPQPFEDVVELECFVRDHLNTTAQKKRMVSAMNLLGGCSLNGSVRKIFCRVATNKVWSKFSLLGRSGKKALCTLSLYKIVYRACCNIHERTVPEKEYETAVRSVLCHAPQKNEIQQSKDRNAK